MLAQRSDIYFPRQHVPGSANVLLDIAHITPVPVGNKPKDRLARSEELWKNILAKVHRSTGFVVLEDAGVEHVDAGIYRVAEHLAPTGLLQELAYGPIFVDDDHAILQRVRYTVEGDSSHGLLGLMECDGLAQIEICQGVAADHQERLG